jgi:hypothetical protein
MEKASPTFAESPILITYPAAMDGVSAAASVAGLITLAQSILAFILKAKSWHKEVPKLELEIKDLEDVVGLLEPLTRNLENLSENPLSEDTLGASNTELLC